MRRTLYEASSSSSISIYYMPYAMVYAGENHIYMLYMLMHYIAIYMMLLLRHAIPTGSRVPGRQ